MYFQAPDCSHVHDFFKISGDIILNEAKTIEVDRNGQPVVLQIPEGTISGLIKRKGEPIAYPKFPAVVDEVSKEAKFTSGALEKGDIIIGLNNQPVRSFAEFQDLKSDLNEKEVEITILRKERDTSKVKVILNKNAVVGFTPLPASKFLEFEKVKYSFFQSLPAGVRKGWNTLVMNVQNFKLLFTSKEVKASESLGSFLSIGNMFGAQWDWERFWSMTALLSIVLAFMNILPIPALDGGHVLFTLYEMITGRKPGDKFMEYAQMAGMVLLLGLMAYALGLDFWRFLFK